MVLMFRRFRDGKLGYERIDHHISGVVDLVFGNALTAQVFLTRRLAYEEQVGDGIRDHKVDLLGHRTVKRAEAGLDMGHWDAELCRSQRTRHCRIHVANYYDAPLGLRGIHQIGFE